MHVSICSRTWCCYSPIRVFVSFVFTLRQYRCYSKQHARMSQDTLLVTMSTLLQEHLISTRVPIQLMQWRTTYHTFFLQWGLHDARRISSRRKVRNNHLQPSELTITLDATPHLWSLPLPYPVVGCNSRRCGCNKEGGFAGLRSTPS